MIIIIIIIVIIIIIIARNGLNGNDYTILRVRPEHGTHDAGMCQLYSNIYYIFYPNMSYFILRHILFTEDTARARNHRYDFAIIATSQDFAEETSALQAHTGDSRNRTRDLSHPKRALHHETESPPRKGADLRSTKRAHRQTDRHTKPVRPARHRRDGGWAGPRRGRNKETSARGGWAQ